LKNNTITNYEKAIRSIPDRVVSDICREFNVNEDWLRNGNGPMFRPVKGINNQILVQVAALIKDDSEDGEWLKYHFARYMSLPVEERKAFNATLKKLFAEVDGK
jgi:hypothetical protein